MQYPEFIKTNDTIGVTACSDGKPSELDKKRLDHAAENLQHAGVKVIETSNCRTSENGRSSSAQDRRKQLEDLLKNDQVKAIIMVSGGEFLCEVLPLLDFSMFLNHPKWVQGYSDPTGLLYTITTNCDLATIYGCNYGDFGMEVWHSSIQDNFDLLTGKEIIQRNFGRYMNGFGEKVTGLEGYELNEVVQWKNAKGIENIEMEGRLLGGCLDVLLNLVGTKYDKTKEFIKKYEKDGILWYLESFDLNAERLATGLWNLREAGWFDTAKGFIFGRPTFYESNTDYEEVVLSMLEPFDVPIVLEACIGHKPPRMTVVNGAYGRVTSSKGSGTLQQEFI